MGLKRGDRGQPRIGAFVKVRDAGMERWSATKLDATGPVKDVEVRLLSSLGQ